MENLADNYKHINGWGIDADPEDQPNYPIKNWTGDDHRRLGWERPPLQPEDREILKSTERPNLSAVFGTGPVPRGLSGAIRRYAFQFTESESGHWLPLLVADRVDMVEGLIDDLKSGHVPNIFAEKGWGAEWKYNREGLIKKVAITAGVVFVASLLLRGKKSK